MTIAELKTTIANFFEKTPADLIVNGQDLGLFALNAARNEAELNHDFEFQRKLVTVSVDGITGGNLEGAVLKSDGTTAVAIKTVVDVGLFDSNDNFVPVEWTTVSEGLERKRVEGRFNSSAYLTGPDQTLGGDYERNFTRFELTGSNLYLSTKANPASTPTTLKVGLEVYGFSSPWVVSDTIVTVTGITSPTSANGSYTVFGNFNNHLVFWNFDYAVANALPSGPYYIWSTGTDWLIKASPENFFSSDYLTLISSSQSPAGTYTVTSGNWTGTAVVAVVFSDTTSDIWTTYGAQYLIWHSICYLNHIFKSFVYRQEGNLPPPEKLRDAALMAFVEWDEARYEQNRRHRR